MKPANRRMPSQREHLLRIAIASAVLSWAYGIGWAQTLVEKGPERQPTVFPDRIILTWNADPARTQAVSWRTDQSVRSGAAELVGSDGAIKWVQYENRTREALMDPASIRRVPAASQDHAETRSLYHQAVFDALTPGREYFYRVGDGEHWSEWLSFRTAAGGREPFRFLYFGDAQFGLRSLWPRALRAALRAAPDARFLVHAGDLVDYGDSDVEWGQWFDSGGWILASVPSIPSPGNHEHTKLSAKPEVWRLSPFWRLQFTLPEHAPQAVAEQAYYVDYQGTRIISLNSVHQIEDQAVWLKDVLRHNPNRWTIVTFHYPLYDAGKRAASLPAMNLARKLWGPIFIEHAVDLVLTGHWHEYFRGPVPPKSKGDGTVGPMWVTSTAGGCCLPTQLYQVVSVNGDRLDFDATTVDGRAYDGFTLVKGRGRRDTVRERRPPGASIVGFRETPDR